MTNKQLARMAARAAAHCIMMTPDERREIEAAMLKLLRTRHRRRGGNAA